MHVHADHAVLQRRTFLGRSSKTVEAFFDDNVLEAQVSEQRDKLCLRQSTGDSTSPQVDIAANRFRQLVRDDDVAVQELSARLEHAEDFTEGLFLVRRQV